MVAVVADGVGGHEGGREAAELAVRGFLDGYFSLPGSLGAQQAAARSLDAINSWIVAQGRVDPRRAGMATTFTALILSGRSGHCVHVGDSRLYRFREEALEQLTEDHVMGRGDLRHVLRRAVGLEDPVRLDHASFTLRPLERYLLCSDGVHGALERREAARNSRPARRAGADGARIWSPPRSMPAAPTMPPRSSSIFSTRRRPEAEKSAISSVNLPIFAPPEPGSIARRLSASARSCPMAATAG